MYYQILISIGLLFYYLLHTNMFNIFDYFPSFSSMLWNGIPEEEGFYYDVKSVVLSFLFSFFPDWVIDRDNQNYIPPPQDDEDGIDFFNLEF